MSNMRTKERDGFSLVELVVAIGILFILTTVTATTVYKDFKDKRISEAVQVATEAAYATALNELNDFDENNDGRADVQNVINEKIGTKNKSGKNDKVDFQVVLQSGITDADFNKDNLCVQGKWKENSKFTSNVGNCDEQQKANPDPVIPDPKILDTITKFTYNCSATGTTEGYVAVTGVDSNAKATVVDVENKKIIELTPKASRFKVALKPNTEYKITVDGKFNELSSIGSSLKDCLVSVDKIGEDTGVSAFYHIGGAKFTSIPNKLPESVNRLRYAFADTAVFNDSSVRSWNMKNITDTSYMFSGAKSFHQHLNTASWYNNLKNLQVTDGMFKDNQKFNGYLSNWDTPKLMSTKYMFQNSVFGATQGASDSLNTWKDVSNVREMQSMFENNSKFNGNLSNWDVSNVSYMNSMFQNATNFNGKLDGWKPGTATSESNTIVNLESMFQNATSFNQNLNSWDTSRITSMKRMFKDATQFNNGTSNTITQTEISALNWEVSNLKDATEMFRTAVNFNQKLVGWDSSEKLYNMHYMFSEAEKFNNGALSGESVALDINTSNVRSMKATFQAAKSFNQSLSSWDTSNVQTMQAMFSDASSFNKSLNSWGGKLANIGTGGKSDDMNDPYAGSMKSMFFRASAFNSYLTWSTIGDNAPVGNVSMENMFSGASSFNGYLTNFNTSKVDNMFRMFKDAESFNKSLTSFDVSNVENMKEMFNNAKSFNGNLSGWDTSNAKSMFAMFRNAESFKGAKGVSDFDVSNVEGSGLIQMFFGASSFNANLDSWELPENANLNSMFSKATSFQNGAIYSFQKTPLTWKNTNNIIATNNMFANSGFNQDISSWNTSNITDMSTMFYQAPNFNQDISKWNICKVSDYDRFAEGATSFQDSYKPKFGKFNLSCMVVSPY